MKNKITDLRNHLFEQLERLNDPDMKGDKLREEIERASAIKDVAQVIVNSAKVEVDAIGALGIDHSPSTFMLEEKTGR